MGRKTQQPVNLKTLLAKAELPALPQSAIRVLELSQDPTKGPDDYALPIESDPGVAGQVLRFVNSSYFGFSHEISTVKSAVTLVGTRTIKNFVLWSAVFDLMPNPKCGPFELKHLWQDSLRRALFARHLARHLEIIDPEEPFAAALLQDMAVPMLAKQAPELYTKLLIAREGGRNRLSALEQKVLGWTHAEAASLMAEHWNLPDTFGALICEHHKIDHWATQIDSAPAHFAVALSTLLPSTVDQGWPECKQYETYCAKVAKRSSSPAKLLEEVDVEFAEFAPLLNLTAPSRSLAERYTAATAASA